MDKYRKINIGLVAIFTIVGIGASLYFDPLCTPVNCQNTSLELIFQMLSGTFCAIGLVFLILKSEYFKMWLKYILSWVIPLGLYFVLSAESFSNSWMPFRKVTAVELVLYLLCFSTILFILGRFLWLRRKNR